MKSRLTPLWVVLGLLAIIGAAYWKGSAQRRPVTLGRLPFGFIDAPQAGAVLRGKVLLGGWALSEAGVASVTIYLDRNLAGFATLGIARPDVQQAFPGIPDTAAAGWQLIFDTTGIRPGAHEMVVQARSKQGATRDLGTVAVTIAR